MGWDILRLEIECEPFDADQTTPGPPSPLSSKSVLLRVSQRLSNAIPLFSRILKGLRPPAANGIRDRGCDIRYNLTEADQAFVGYAGGRG